MTKLGKQRQPPARKSLLVSDFRRPCCWSFATCQDLGSVQGCFWSARRAVGWALGSPRGSSAASTPRSDFGSKQPRLYSFLILLARSPALQQLFIESSGSRTELWEAAEAFLKCFSLKRWGRGTSWAFQPPQCPRSGMPLLRDAEFPGADLIPPALHLCAQAAQRDHCRKTMIPLGVLLAAALFIPF